MNVPQNRTGTYPSPHLDPFLRQHCAPSLGFQVCPFLSRGRNADEWWNIPWMGGEGIARDTDTRKITVLMWHTTAAQIPTYLIMK